MSRYGTLALALLLVLSPLAAYLPGDATGSRPSSSGLGLSLTAAPIRGAAPLAIAFTAAATPASTSTTFRWSFGDGASYLDTGVARSSPIHDYALAGNYTVNVTATEGTVEANASLVVEVLVENLSVVVVATPTSGPAPLTVQLGAEVAGGTGTYASVLWNFGDGDLGSGTSINYTYGSPGTFRATVTVTDSGSASASTTVPITVSPDPAPPGHAASPALGAYLAPLAVVTALLAAGAVAAIGYRSVVLRRAQRGGAPPGALVEPVSPGLAAQRPGPETAWPPTSVAPAPPDGALAAQSESRRLSERILIHLYWYGRPGPDGIARAQASQQGIARSLGSEQNVLSKPLRRLIDSGLVRVELAHVPGAPRRVKAYFLTPKGEAVARSLGRASRPSTSDPRSGA